eukprot:TRINITY_DN30539_c0_g1_i1.p1 TRINITY_DN30539_c0_g1~~TRINITY_DN30539_c0_g1_i1.p1  ORF type:complete len:242 (-),score=53.12 TRINITY_DN30539_c0_g1_i1:345-1022(-)
MASLEIAAITENANGAAFEVKIKKQGGEQPASAAQMRLESYPAPQFPTLLQSRALASAPAPVSKERAEKAKKQNALKVSVVERASAEYASSISAKREHLDKQLGQARQKREGALADIKARAAEHFEKAKAHKSAFRQRQTEVSAALRQRLEEMLDKKCALRDATLARRLSHASKHNETVACKVIQHQEAQKRHTDEFRSRVVVPAERFARLSMRLYEHHYVAHPQ